MKKLTLWIILLAGLVFLPALPAPTRWVDPFLVDHLFQGVLAYRYSIIKSINSYTITFSTASLTGTKTITSVNTASACVQTTSIGNHSLSGSTPAYNAVGYQITGATTVTANVGATATGNESNGFDVIEYYPNELKSLQQVTGSDTSTSAVASVSAVTIAKTWLCWGGFTTSLTTASNWYQFTNNSSPYLSSTTAVTMAHYNSGGNTWTGYVTTVEFK